MGEGGGSLGVLEVGGSFTLWLMSKSLSMMLRMVINGGGKKRRFMNGGRGKKLVVVVLAIVLGLLMHGVIVRAGKRHTSSSLEGRIGEEEADFGEVETERKVEGGLTEVEGGEGGKTADGGGGNEVKEKEEGGEKQRSTAGSNIRHRTAPEECKVEKYGGYVEKGYGLWAICSNWLDDKTVLYSFGIGPDSTFDVTVVENHNSTVFCFDPTISTDDFEQTVNRAKPRNPWEKRSFLNFHQLGLGAVDKVVTFYRKGAKGSAISVEGGVTGYHSVAAEAQVLTIPSIMQKFGHDYVDVIKVDIEGTEYDVFKSGATPWLDYMQPQQIMLEFHNRFFTDTKVKGYEMEKDVVDNILKYGYKIVWKSGNNWEMLLVKEKL